MTKYSQPYSFKSPLSFAAIRDRLRDLPPWQWEAADGQSVIARLPAPDRGTIKITVRRGTNVVEMNAEATSEGIRAIYDTLFTHVLPAISGSDVKEGIEPEPPERPRIYVHVAYAFESPFGLHEMVAKLNAAGPWTWYERENDRLDDYLSTAPLREPHHGRAKIFYRAGRPVVDVEMSSGEPDADAVIKDVERELHERVLPSIGATNIRETETLD